MSRWFSRRVTLSESPVMHTPAAVRVRPYWQDILHVFALVNFAVAQPVYDRLAQRHVFLLDLRLGWAGAYLLAACLSAGLPAILVTLEGLVRHFKRSAYDRVHFLLVGV